MNNLSEQIRTLCKQKNAIIMAHYYQRPGIQDVADFVGDSLALAQVAAKTDADIIVMCGVHFMAETAKILCPDKKVLIPEPAAGCSLADSCKAEDLAAWKAEHPDHLVVSYVNTSAAVKALTDVVVTSSVRSSNVSSTARYFFMVSPLSPKSFLTTYDASANKKFPPIQNRCRFYPVTTASSVFSAGNTTLKIYFSSPFVM